MRGNEESTTCVGITLGFDVLKRMPGRLVFLEAASFGGPDNFRLGGCALKTVLYDIRFAWRQLIKMPGFTVTAIVSLALGIGATTAVFSVVYAILMDPYPYTAPDRMVHTDLIMTDGHSREFIGITRPEWQQLRKSQVVEDSFLQGSRNMTISGSEFPEDVLVVDLSSNAFNFLGVPAALGRTLEPSDAIDGQDPAPVVVLGYKFWQRHFNGDTSVIGKTLQLDHQNYTVVGVAGERFAWGDGDFYLPLKITGDQTTAYYVCTRLKPGITHAQADALRRVRARDSQGFSCRKAESSRGGPERAVCEGPGRHAVPAVWRSCIAPPDWLRQRVDPAAGASHGAAT